MRNVVKIGCVALFVGGLIMLPAIQARQRRSAYLVRKRHPMQRVRWHR